MKKFNPRALAAKFRDNPVAISEYLSDAFSTGDAMVIAKAIGDMVRAQGMSRFSRKSGLGRENLYRIFSGNPKIETVMKALVALDIQLKATPSADLSRPTKISPDFREDRVDRAKAKGK
jgi:probable addiction module antidote protein